MSRESQGRRDFRRVYHERRMEDAVPLAVDRVISWAAGRQCYCRDIFAPGRTVLCVTCQAREVQLWEGWAEWKEARS